MLTASPVIYQIKVSLLGISPMIRRRLMIHGDSTITDLHHILQIAMGWSDDHLHRFRIHGKRYGIARIGGVWFSNDPDAVRLKNFHPWINERFYYEYDFTDSWQHQLRIEAILAPEPHRHYPVCIAGRQAAPPEECGGPWAFMALRQRFSFKYVITRLAEIFEDRETLEEHWQELDDLRYWLSAEHFDRKGTNRRLTDYARSKNMSPQEVPDETQGAGRFSIR